MAALDDLLFKPTFEEPQAGDTRDREERDDAAALKTYRYLRLGMVVIVVALLVSVAIQGLDAKCLQNSISAYYYTPARPIFVSGMIAIAVSLIVIKGSTTVEDFLLNIAGMFAPIVAFVPTTFEPACNPEESLVLGGGKLPANIIRDVENNIGTMLIAGAVALLIAALVFIIEQVRNDKAATRHVTARVVLLALTGLLLLWGWWLLASEKILDLHGKAAAALFAALALASIMNGAWLWWLNRGGGPKTYPRWKVFAVLYIAVGLAMGLAGVIIAKWPGPWDHRTLVLELAEIGLFVAMWIVQSVERWGKILQA